MCHTAFNPRWQIAYGIMACLLMLAPLGTLHAQFRVQPQASPGDGIGVVPYRPVQRQDHYRATFSVGGNIQMINDAPLAIELSAAYQHNHTIYTALFLQSTNNQRFPLKLWQEAGALVGYAISSDITHEGRAPDEYSLSFSGGVSFYSYEETYRFRRFRRGQPVDSTTLAQIAASPANSFESGIGIPLQVQAIYEPYPFIGIGATLFGNINKLRSNYGGMLSLQAGWF